MAEYDPTQLGDSWEEEEEYSGEDEAQEENPDDQMEQDPANSGSEPSGDSASGSGSGGADDDDAPDYEPASATSIPPSSTSTPQVVEAQTSVDPSLQPTTKKPKTAGGFLVGDSDSEDETSTPNARYSPSASQAPLPNISAPHQATSGSANLPAVPQASAQASNDADLDREETKFAAPTMLPTAPPPQDRTAALEQRVNEDPRGATEAWLELISEHRANNNIEAARNVYDRFLSVYPQAANVWVGYLEMELAMNNLGEVERIFGACLMSTPNVALWSKYLDYIRRRNDLTGDGGGQARQVIHQAYDFVIDNIGLDKDSGKIWADYIEFIKSGPGSVGGSGWQDMQKMDQLRRAYQRAICVPVSNVNTLWKEYDQFEMGLNKVTGRRYLAEKSPAYMSAKSAYTAIENATRGLSRTTVPRLPPAPGFDGDVEFAEQVSLWHKWIALEKSDPLDIQDDKEQPGLFNKRILYVYKQALMALRFWPELWVEAAEWCFENEVASAEGLPVGPDLLTQGIAANPESVLLALKHADHVEMTHPNEENEDAKIARGLAVRAPYLRCLDTLYGLVKSLKERETTEIAKIEAAAALDTHVPHGIDGAEDDDDNDNTQATAKEQAKNNQIHAIQQGFSAQTQLISRSITFVWIAYIRAMRRIQGKGKLGDAMGGMRQAFAEARQRGRVTSDVYSAVAQMEWVIYKEPAGGKIFERGAKLFPEDENFTLEYIKHLHSRDDITNARVLFETVVNKLTQKPETVPRSKILYSYFHKYESLYGELSQVAKLEKRMAELFPEDSKLSHFNARFSTDKYDPITARIIISPIAQLRPKQAILASIEQGVSLNNSPAPMRQFQSPRPQPLLQAVQSVNSPKRPYPGDEIDDNPPRKIHRTDQTDFQRGVSPLKGAAGRRLDQQRRLQGHGTTIATQSTGPTPLARDITFFMSLIPSAASFTHPRYNPSDIVRILREINVPDYTAYMNQRKDDHPSSSRVAPGQAHGRHISGEYGHYGYSSRDSPNPPNRPASPYGRTAPSYAPYRQSSLRPGSSGSYEPPPAQTAQYAQGLPPPPGQFEPGAWPMAFPPPNHAPPQPMGYGQNPGAPHQQSAYPQYRY